jgi:hypothetical protein
MKSIEKQKMCPHCEGRIPFEVEVCPYCSHETSLQASKPQSPLFHSQSLEDSLASLYKPPYQSKTPSSMETEKHSNPLHVEASLYGQPAPQPQNELRETKSSLPPTILLLLASQLFILGLLQFFFAKDGIVHLEWDGSHWFFYCLFALPLFYFGWKKLQNLSE